MSPETETNVRKTISILKPRLGFRVRLFRDSPLLGRVVDIREVGRAYYPLNILVEYPIHSGIIWDSLSASSRQAYIDYDLFRGNTTAFHLGSDGPNGNPLYWYYEQPNGQWKLINRILSPLVRSGQVSVDSIAASEEELERVLPGLNSDFQLLPSFQVGKHRTQLLDTIDHLLLLLPDRADEILDLEGSHLGEERGVVASKVKKSSNPNLKNPQSKRRKICKTQTTKN